MRMRRPRQDSHNDVQEPFDQRIIALLPNKTGGNETKCLLVSFISSFKMPLVLKEGATPSF